MAKYEDMRSEHLVEATLGEFLRERVDPDIIHNRKFVFPGSGGEYCRPDYRSEKHRLIVEFDGWRHYSSAKQVVADRCNTRSCWYVGYSVIRIPYFVQLDGPMVEFLFKPYAADLSGWNSYPHGFISKVAMLPADFCEIGILRFLYDWWLLEPARRSIIDSLKTALGHLRDECCYPPSLVEAFPELDLDWSAPSDRDISEYDIVPPIKEEIAPRYEQIKRRIDSLLLEAEAFRLRSWERPSAPPRPLL